MKAEVNADASVTVVNPEDDGSALGRSKTCRIIGSGDSVFQGRDGGIGVFQPKA